MLVARNGRSDSLTLEGRVVSPAQGIDELLAIADRSRLERYPFYPAAIGELELRRGNLDAARFQFSAALTLARNAAERRYLEKILEKCRGL